jgi:hypothetical protein
MVPSVDEDRDIVIIPWYVAVPAPVIPPSLEPAIGDLNVET